MRSVLFAGGLVGAVLAFAGCGGQDQSTMMPPPPGKMPPPASCAYIFENTVLMGPDANLSLIGKLVLVQDTPSTLAGTLIPGGVVPDGGAAPDGPRLHVDGSLNGTTITLTITLQNGFKVVASGPDTTLFYQCPAPLQGSSTGPGSADEGAWMITAVD
jgi:hypothetical protein